MRDDDGYGRMERRWHIDKGIPVALVVAILGQGLLFAYYLGQEVSRGEERDRRIDALEKQVNPIGPRLKGIEVRLDFIIRRMDREEENRLRDRSQLGPRRGVPVPPSREPG